jgi:hypothetical protein
MIPVHRIPIHHLRRASRSQRYVTMSCDGMLGVVPRNSGVQRDYGTPDRR